MGDLFFRSFEKGVVANVAPTKLVETASPRAWNTAFRADPAGTTFVGARPGFRKIAWLNNDNLTIIGQAFLAFQTTTVNIIHHVVLRSDGTLWEIIGETPVQITIPTGTEEFPGSSFGTLAPEYGVTWVQADNKLFGFIRPGPGLGYTPIAFKIWRGNTPSTLYCGRIGLPVPPAPTFVSEVGGNTTGTIDFRVAWANSKVGLEGPMSDIYSRAVTAKAVTIGLPTAAPSEVDKIRIYVRKQEIGTTFARSAAMELDRGETQFTLDATDAQFNQMTITGAPSDTAWKRMNSEAIRCAEWHLNRLFVSDGQVIQYSDSDNPEHFDAKSEETLSEGAGELILGLKSIRDDVLGVFKERSIHGIVGQTPASWDQDVLVPDLGCISTRSLVQGDGLIGFWSERGPAIWALGAQPEIIGDLILEQRVRENRIYKALGDGVLGTFDPEGHRFLWRLSIVPGPTQETHTVVPFSTRHKVWESLGWDLEGVTDLMAGYGPSGVPRVYFGGEKGVVYELTHTCRRDAATEDSAAAWTTITAGTTTGVTLAAGSPTVNPHRSRARLIDIRTLQVHRGTYTLAGTALTWTTASSFTPSVGSIVVFDGPVTEWDTVDSVVGAPNLEKRVLQTYAEVWAAGDTPVLFGLYKDNVVLPRRVWQTTIAKNAKDWIRQGPVLGGAVQSHKRWGGVPCQWIRMRFLGWYPRTDWKLVHMGFSVIAHDDEN